jgi:hypothetical protein
MAFSVFRNSKAICVHRRTEDIFALIFYQCLLWDSTVCAPDALLKFSARTTDESVFDPKGDVRR